MEPPLISGGNMAAAVAKIGGASLQWSRR